jgi:hypothetical protein
VGSLSGRQCFWTDQAVQEFTFELIPEQRFVPVELAGTCFVPHFGEGVQWEFCKRGEVGSREGVLFGVPEVELRSSFRVQQPSFAE